MESAGAAPLDIDAGAPVRAKDMILRKSRTASVKGQPRAYRVYAWEEVEATAGLDPEFLKPLEEKGTAVTVAENSEVSVEVQLIPAKP